jgi:hypothetical protein
VGFRDPSEVFPAAKTRVDDGVIYRVEAGIIPVKRVKKGQHVNARKVREFIG